MRTPERILVIRPDRIGDVVLSTPTIRALRTSFPRAYLGALVRPGTEPVLRNNPHLDTVIIDDIDGTEAGRHGFMRMVRELRRHRFDTALMLLPTERHAWMTFLAGIRHRVGVGTKLYQVLSFAGSVSRNKYREGRHEADYCLDLARAIGAVDDGLATEIVVTTEERNAAAEYLGQRGFQPARATVMLVPESGRSAPNWETPEYLRLAELLLDRHDNVQLLIACPPGQADLPAAFESLAPGRSIAVQGDLSRLIACVSLSDALVSASTGPMHIAGALRIPTVSLFCPLPACAPSLWRPLGNTAVTLMPVPEYCNTQCPGDPHVCTLAGGISAGDVRSALAEIISE